MANTLVREINNQLIMKFSLNTRPKKNGVGEKENLNIEIKDEIKLVELLELFIKDKELACENKEIRIETLKTYKSRRNVLLKFIKEVNLLNMSIYDLNPKFIKSFSHYISFTKKRTDIYHNSNLVNLKNFVNWLKVEGIELDIPPKSFKKKKETSKVREVITPVWRNKIITYLKIKNPAYLTLCMFTYYGFIRAKELSFLQVKHVNMLDRTITIEDYFSKNKKTQKITIPNALVAYISTMNLEKYPSNYFLFSKNEMLPGLKKILPKQIGYEWQKMRKSIGLPMQFQWYSLKDSGIEALLQKGVPILEVQRQCRHHDIKMTQKYVKSSISEASEYIQNSEVKF